MPRKVLIVDDEYMFAEFTQMILESEGYETRISLGGAKAMEMALAEKPDLVLMDISMPDINGIDLLQKFKAHPETKDIPVILCSITKNEREVTQIHELGAASFIAKPIKRDLLRKQIDKALSGKGS